MSRVTAQEAGGITRVDAGASGSLDAGELWRYRELLYFLTWRDVKVRYKQTLLGVAWAVVQPFMTMVVFSVFFGYLAGMPSEDVPYPLFAYAGLLPWTYFAQVVGASSLSVVSNSNLITKVYFPRIIIPLASSLAALVDFAVAFVVLVGLQVFFHFYPPAGYDFRPNAGLAFLPLFALMAMSTAVGVGLWLSAVNVRYRDVRHVIPFIIQFWLFATPVIYPSTFLQGAWRFLYAANPMVGVVEGFRWALLDTEARLDMLWVSGTVSLLLLASGALYFRRMERIFADVV